MIRKDYILKLVEQFALLLSKLMGLKQEGDYKGAIEAIDHFLKKNTRIDLILLNHWSVEELLSNLNSNEMSKDQWTFIADTLYEEAEIRQLMDEEDGCFDSRQKAFLIYTFLIKNNLQTFSLQMMGKVENLISYIEQFSLHPEAYYRLFLFWMEGGKYAKAEDVLFGFAEHYKNEDILMRKAVKEYENLLLLTDEQLQAGDLPRKELEAGIADLKSVIKW